MADNSLQNFMDTYIMPQALPVLREACMMPALVSRNYDGAPFEKNAVLRIPLPQDLGPADDFDTNIGSGSTALSDPKVDVTLDKWKYKQFEMNDKELRETMASTAALPSAAEAALRSIANAIDLDLLDLMNDIPYVAGAPGGGVNKDVLIDARQVMNDNLAPAYPRFALWNTIHESELLKSITEWSKTGEIATTALRQANLGTLLGFDSYQDQNMRSRVPGTATADVLTVSVSVDAGATSLPLSGSTGTKTLKRGDLFTIAGVVDEFNRPLAFVVTSNVSAVNGAFGSVGIYPALPVAVPANRALTFVRGSGATGVTTESLAFHRDAFMIAMRTLSNESSETSTISVKVDPVTGIPLRLETWRDPRFAKRMWRFDVLYGVKTIRPIFATRIVG